MLARWTGERSERAFHELVARYAGLVHAAARRTCGDESMAGEAAQMVFVLLARKAGELSGRKSLAGWLHVSAVMQAKNLLRAQRRERAKREKLQNAMNQMPKETGPDLWEGIKPLIDDALASLPEKDREAVLLHFYRSLTAREIAETLGIATAAAKKRIGRAVDKLRGKLAARGVDAGEALPSVMLAGFAADGMNVGLPLKLIAAKAMSAGGAAVMPATVFMKVLPYVSPVLALVAAGLWIIPKREAVASVERKTALLEAGGGGREGPGRDPLKKAGGRGDHGKTGRKSIDWEAVAAAEADEQSSGRIRNFVGINQMMLDRRLEAMANEELIAELDRIDASDVSSEAKDRMRNRLYHLIARRDPAFALSHLQLRLGREDGVGFALTTALKLYAKDHPVEAEVWLERQIGEGRLQVKRLDGRNWDRDRLEGALIFARMVSSPESAAVRLMTMDPKDRMMALGSLPPRFPKEEQIAYAKLVREVIEPQDQPKMIARVGLVLNDDFKWVDDYLERIEATPEEKAVTYDRAATYALVNTSMGRKLTIAEVAKAWNWMEKNAPEARDRVIGDALANAWSDQSPTGFVDVAALATAINKFGNNDGVLVAFLKNKGVASQKEVTREMVELISNEQLKTEMREVLK